MDTRKKPKVGFVPCLSFVKKGVANPKLGKLKASKEEMQQVVKELRLREAEFKNRPKKGEEQDDEAAEEEPMRDDDNNAGNENAVIDDYYDLDNYDDDDEPPVESGISYSSTTDALLLNSAPDESETDDDEDDSDEEAEEFSVKPDDNILVCGQVGDDELCVLQLYVLNVEKQEFFLLNDIYLPTFPVAVEWLDFNNPKENNTPGHYAAVGYVEPEIQVWDLNVSECLEPAFSLGAKKQKKTQRHKGAVLDLSWNTSVRNVLASGSADNTVILWDMTQCKSVTRLECFSEKVQSVQWHPMEAQSLLTGVCDGTVKLFDCRSPNTHKTTWQFEGEIERVMWNKFEPLHFFASTEKGMVHYVDVRATKPVWNLNAHTSSVGGMALSSYCRDFLVTGSTDEFAKVWDLKDNNTPTLVTEKQMHIGHIYAISPCPDSPYVFAAGGANPDNHLYVWDVRECPGVVERFSDRLDVVVSERGRGGDDDNKMEDGNSDEENPASGAFQFKQTTSKKVTGGVGGGASTSTSSSSTKSTAPKQSAKSVSKKTKKTNKKP